MISMLGVYGPEVCHFAVIRGTFKTWLPVGIAWSNVIFGASFFYAHLKMTMVQAIPCSKVKMALKMALHEIVPF